MSENAKVRNTVTKLGIIGGAGLLGATTAFCAAAEGLADEIILSDLKENMAHSHARDIEQAICESSETKLFVGAIDDLKSCDIVLNTAGIPEMKAGSRDDYLNGNIEIYRQIAEKIKRWGTSPVILSATNPIDVLNYRFFEMTQLPPEKFIGFSRNDSLRFIWSASRETGIPSPRLEALVIGEHGDGQVPLFGTLRDKQSGQALSLSDGQKNSILQRVKTWFGEYQELDSGRSSGWTSGVGLCRVIKLILTDSDEICPCSVIPHGQYGLRDLSIGLPVRLGKSGVREIVKLELSEDENVRLQSAAEKIKKLIASSRG